MLFNEKLSLVWELKAYPSRKNLFKSQPNIVKLTWFPLALFDLPAGYHLLQQKKTSNILLSLSILVDKNLFRGFFLLWTSFYPPGRNPMST